MGEDERTRTLASAHAQQSLRRVSMVGCTLNCGNPHHVKTLAGTRVRNGGSLARRGLNLFPEAPFFLFSTGIRVGGPGKCPERVSAAAPGKLRERVLPSSAAPFAAAVTVLSFPSHPLAPVPTSRFLTLQPLSTLEQFDYVIFTVLPFFCLPRVHAASVLR
jgi:hypothetical protein